MFSILQDLRQVIRTFRSRSSSSTVIILMLALGIGSNGAIFTLVNSIMLHPLPYVEPENLVIAWETNFKRGWRNMTASFPNYDDWRKKNQSFEDLGAFYQNSMTVGVGSEPNQVWATSVSTGLFPMLRIHPMLGRTFLPEDEQPTTGLSVILGYDIWMQLFNGDHDVIGKSVILNEQKYTVVGVMPQEFEFPPRFRQGDYQVPKVDLWIPIKGLNPEREPRTSHYMFVLGRLKHGITLKQAQADMNIVAADIEKQYSTTNKGWGIRLVTLQNHYAGDMRLLLLTLLGAVSFLTLIACANIANLRLSQSLSRRNEFAIRSALGCGRGRLMRLLMMESILLSIAGGAVGLAIADGALRLLIVIGTTDPRLLGAKLDGRVISYTLIISMGAAILFGVLPALRASKTDFMTLLRVDGQMTSAGGQRSYLAQCLVVAEVVFSFVLLIGAGLMLRSFINLQNVDVGFDRSNILTAQILLPASRYSSPERPTQFFEQLLQRINALPGVESASMASDTPLDNQTFVLSFDIENRVKRPDEALSASVRIVAPKYFRTMGVRLIAGRDFDVSDAGAAPGVVIINEAMARKYWPSEDPIEKVVSIDFPAEQQRFGKSIRRRVIGIVADIRDDRPEAAASPSLYVPHGQRPWTRMTLVLHSRLPLNSLAASIRNEVRQLDGNLVIYNIKTIEQWVSEAIYRHRFAAFLLNSFAALALIITTMGIYSVVSNSVLSRSKEFGIRMALGASSEMIIRSVIKQMGGLVLVGMAVGLGAAILLTRLLTGLLFEISPLNFSTYVIISAILISVALLAIYLPIKRVTEIDPSLTLRSR
jgi:predicted permease